MSEISEEELRNREETVRQLASAALRQLQRLNFPVQESDSFAIIGCSTQVCWNGSHETGWRVTPDVYILCDGTLVMRERGRHVDTFKQLAVDIHNIYYSRGQLKSVAMGLLDLIGLENPNNEDLGGVNTYQLRAILDIPARTLSSKPTPEEMRAEQRAHLPRWRRWLS